MKQGEAAPTIADVARETRRKAAYLRRKAVLEQREAYALAKRFFTAYIGKEAEFTMEELRRELHKVYLSTAVRDQVDALLEKLGLLEYTDTRYSQAELKQLIADLDGIVKMMVVEREGRLPLLTRLADWLFRKRRQPPRTELTEYPVVERQEPAYIELNSILEAIYVSLSEGKAKRAARQYRALLKRYDSLGPSVQHDFYHKVHEAYRAIVERAHSR